jgi:hypothetical protein
MGTRRLFVGLGLFCLYTRSLLEGPVVKAIARHHNGHSQVVRGFDYTGSCYFA